MGTTEDNIEQPPQVQLEQQADGGLKVSWGPEKGRWGVYTETADPVEVTIDDWCLYVSEKPSGVGAKPKPILSECITTKTEEIIPYDKLPKHKTVIAQVVGRFKSFDIKGAGFTEGIYSEPKELEIKW